MYQTSPTPLCTGRARDAVGLQVARPRRLGRTTQTSTPSAAPGVADA